MIKNYKAKKDFYPHLNLYDLSVPKDKLMDIIKTIKFLTLNQRSFKIKTEKISFFPFGIIFWKIQQNQQLELLHKQLVKMIFIFKGNCIDKDYLSKKRKYTKKQQKLLIQYGNPFVLDQFRPHITIGFINNKKQLANICKELNSQFKPQEFIFNNIHIKTEDNKIRKFKIYS